MRGTILLGFEALLGLQGRSCHGAGTEAQKRGALSAWGNHAKTEWGADVGEKVRGPVLRLGIFSFILLIPAQG